MRHVNWCLKISMDSCYRKNIGQPRNETYLTSHNACNHSYIRLAKPKMSHQVPVGKFISSWCKTSGAYARFVSPYTTLKGVRHHLAERYGYINNNNLYKEIIAIRLIYWKTNVYFYTWYMPRLEYSGWTWLWLNRHQAINTHGNECVW